MEKKIISVPGHTLDIYTPETVSCVMYSSFSDKDVEAIYKIKTCRTMAIVSIHDIDWNRDLSPWPAEKVFRDGEDFTGGADAFIEELCEKIIPAAEEALDCIAPLRGIAGYSLSGLFAIYAAYKTELFNMAASMSGSMWYDGWLDYMRNHECKLKKAYFSVGSKEKNTRNVRMARVEECTRRAALILSEQGIKTDFQLNSGNHFVDVPLRIARGMKWLVEN